MPEEIQEDAEVEETTEVETEETAGEESAGEEKVEQEEAKEAPEEAAINPEDYEVETREMDSDAEVDYGDEIDPEDAKTIGTIVEKQTASVKSKLQDTQDRLEVDGYLAENPQFKKFKPVILKHMKHPAYRQIPVKNIAAMVASKDLMQMGAEAERKAQADADATKNKDTPARKPAGGKRDWKKAPKEAFEEQVRKVKGMQV